MFFRTLLHVLFLSRRKPDLGHYDIARTNFITLPTDLDINRHMNNGVYFSIMDVARFDMLVRNGVWRAFRSKGWYPVVASETITFRKSLSLWQRFTIESKLLGYDDRAVYIEQRFVRPGRRRARGCSPRVHPGRFLASRRRGAVPELIAEFGALESEGSPSGSSDGARMSRCRPRVPRRRPSGTEPPDRGARHPLYVSLRAGELSR